MGSHITHNEVVSGQLTMKMADAIRFVLDHGEDGYAESAFVRDVIEGAGLDFYSLREIDVEAFLGAPPVPIHPTWTGVWSSRSLDRYEGLLRLTQGSADIICHYDHGECEGYRVVDGHVTKHSVVLALGEAL